MIKRLNDRDDVTRLRFTREAPKDSLGRDLLANVDSICPDGFVFHVIGDTPDDTGDLLIIVIDGEKVVRFELPRLEGRERRTAGPPRDIEIKSMADFRRIRGQGSHRHLDLIVADAQRVLANRN